MSFLSRNFATIFLVGFGLVFIAVGTGIGIFGSRATAAEAERAQRLTALAPSALDRLVPGAELLVEGALSPRNSVQFRSYLAYIRAEFRGTDEDGDSEWVVDERVTPRLLVEVDGQSGALLQIGNSDYLIERPHETWQASEGLSYNGLTGEGTKYYQGLLADRRVMVIGLMQAGSEGPELRAELIYGGTRAEYIAAKRAAAAWLPWFGLIFVGIGLIPLAIGFFLAFRRG
jgi:hypothetical protein